MFTEIFLEREREEKRRERERERERDYLELTMESSVLEKKIGADNRFPLSFYYRIANQFVNQAKVFREEQNISDLYTTLSRYCRLAEVLPQHRSYSTHSSKEKLHHNKMYQEFIKELEILKPVVDCDLWSQKNNSLSSFSESKVKCCGIAEMKSPSFSRVYEENTGLAPVITMDSSGSYLPLGTISSASSTTAKDWDVNVHIVTQSSPSPVLSCIQSMPQVARVSHHTVPDSRHGHSESSFSGASESRVLQDVHISARLMEDFLELARDNTNKDLETCGVLGAFLKKGTFYVTTLIVPKQESTSGSCQALNEEEIYAIQNEKSLFPVGWIHTHPSQTCFMSSIDLHTHYSYQVMLPEAFAIVMAPTDTTRSYGIFRLSDPGGTNVLKECQERGFHSHQEPYDGSPIYEYCSNVYINPNLRFEIFDLR